MRKVIVIAAILGLSACSPVGTAAGVVGGAAKSAVQTVGGLFN